eukprot:1028101-Rhodomonas_salina.3
MGADRALGKTYDPWSAAFALQLRPPHILVTAHPVLSGPSKQLEVSSSWSPMDPDPRISVSGGWAERGGRPSPATVTYLCPTRTPFPITSTRTVST